MTSSTEKLRLRIYLGVLCAVMFLGTFGFMLAEGLSLTDAIYFTIVTIATVGYGDISPATSLGKILSIVLIVGGVGTFVGVVANAFEIFLDRRDREAREQKLNMVVGLFFSEAGTRLLRFFAGADPGTASLGATLTVRNAWTEQDFNRAAREIKSYPFAIDMARVDLKELSDFLNDTGKLLVRLLESPYMLERESFTDLLIAVLHFKEELLHREDLDRLPESDRDHLAGDAKRVYRNLTLQWLDYVKNLKASYPFLFSLALRTNPFDADASPTVR